MLELCLPRPDVFFFDDFALEAAFFAVFLLVFLAAAFLRAVFFFDAEVFRAAFLAVDFLRVDFLRAAFLRAAFLAVLTRVDFLRVALARDFRDAAFFFALEDRFFLDADFLRDAVFFFANSQFPD